VSNSRVFSGSEKNELIDYLTGLAEHEDNLYRGYSKQDELLPSIIRKREMDIEIELLKEFERYGAHYFSAVNPVDFMSYAQHYGLPTRLLDFTTNPFIALYFAMFKQKGPRYTVADDKDYYYIRYARRIESLCFDELPVRFSDMYYDDNSIYSPTQDLEIRGGAKKPMTGYSLWSKARRMLYEIENTTRQSVDGILQSGIRGERLLFIEPNQSNQRIIMQQGLFMLPYTLNQTKLQEILDKNTTVIMIQKNLRETMLSYLDTVGINAFRLMPDLQNICEAVERKVRERRNISDESAKRVYLENRLKGN